MAKKRKHIQLLIFIIIVVAVIVSLSVRVLDRRSGMLLVPDGMGGEMWVKQYKDLPVSSFSSEEFSSDGEYLRYKGEDYKALRGIDVSEHQSEIDWEAVKSDGVEFAIIRAGYRGYSEGNIYEDEYFRKNIEAAADVGIEVGVYYFSQAVSVTEAEEEAGFLIDILADYQLDLPVFYDWEPVIEETSRTKSYEGELITDCCLAFCNAVEKAGYEAGVYFDRNLGYTKYALDKISDLTFWSAAPGDYPDFYYAHSIWQYSFKASVSGIGADTDLNLMFVATEDE